jgi:tyrosine-protein kinase Etk/Wzc
MEVVNPGDRGARDRPGALQASPSPFEEAPGGTLAYLVATISQARWLIAGVAVAALALGVLYALAATPVYRSDVLIQVEQRTTTLAGLAQLSSLLTEPLPSETEIELIRSRALVGSVVDELGLQVRASPIRFPLLGAIASKRQLAEPSPPWLGLAPFAWGGEKIHVARLDVPEGRLGEALTLVAGEAGRYELYGESGERLLSGVVGQPAAAGAGVQRVAAFVSELVARPGTRFRVVKRTWNAAVESLQDGLKAAERTKNTGVIAIQLEDTDRKRLAATLDAVAKTYVRQNVERKSEEAAKTLAFLETQLPQLRANLDAAEAARKGYQMRRGTLDLSREAGSLLDRSVALEAALSEAHLQQADLLQRFTPNHPALQALASKIEKLKRERGEVEAKMRELPATEMESTRLSRDVKVAGELYNVLLNKAQELRVVKSGTVGNVRMVDAATVPDAPVRPNLLLAVAFSLMLGGIVGVSAAFARRALYAGVDDPDAVERVTGLAVYATIPRSATQSRLWHVGKSKPRPILAAESPGDPAVEGVRSLRTALQFALIDSSSHVVVVTGPTAGVGKSFVAANLAYVAAAAGRRVLVLDGDLRRGSLHRIFGGGRAPGLSDVLRGTATLADAVRPGGLPGLAFLATGVIPPNPSELLASDRFERLLGELSERFDLVLVDTAPVLPVTDAALVGRHAAATLLVLGAGVHRAHEITAALRRLAHNGVRVQGAVLNDFSGTGARHSRYRYEYRYASVGPATA